MPLLRRTRRRKRRLEDDPTTLRLFADCRPEIEALVKNSGGKSAGEIIRELVSEAIVARRLKRLGRTVRSANELPPEAGDLMPDLEPSDSVLSGIFERLDRIESAAVSGLDVGKHVLERLEDEATRLEAVSRFGAQSAAQGAALLWLLIRSHPEFADKSDQEFDESRRHIARVILGELDATVDGEVESGPSPA